MSLPIPPRRRSRSRRRQTSRPIEISKSITRALRWQQHDPSAWREFGAVKEVVSHKLPDADDDEIWHVITHSMGGSGESYKFDFRRIGGVWECKLAEGHVLERTLRETPWRCEAADEADEAVEAADEAGEADEVKEEEDESWVSPAEFMEEPTPPSMPPTQRQLLLATTRERSQIHGYSGLFAIK